jgi:hypothetical protein
MSSLSKVEFETAGERQILHAAAAAAALLNLTPLQQSSCCCCWLKEYLETYVRELYGGIIKFARKLAGEMRVQQQQRQYFCQLERRRDKKQRAGGNSRVTALF